MKQKTKFKILEISVSADISAHEWLIYRYWPKKRHIGRSLPEITSMENAYKWMQESTGLKIETETLTTAAQDHALNTKCHKAKILHDDKRSKMQDVQREG